MSGPYLLENWSLIVDADQGYAAPESLDVRACGQVYNHPKYLSGERIITGTIVMVQGRILITLSGSHYVLGDPATSYLAWLEDQGYEYDQENPLREMRRPT